MPLIIIALTFLSLISPDLSAQKLCSIESNVESLSVKNHEALHNKDLLPNKNTTAKILNNTDNFKSVAKFNNYIIYLTQSDTEELKAYEKYNFLRVFVHADEALKQNLKLINLYRFNGVIITNKFSHGIIPNIYSNLSINYFTNNYNSTPKKILLRDPSLNTINLFINSDLNYAQTNHLLVQESTTLFDKPSLEYIRSSAKSEKQSTLYSLSINFRASLGLLNLYKNLNYAYQTSEEKYFFCQHSHAYRFLQGLPFNPDKYIDDYGQVMISKFAKDFLDIAIKNKFSCSGQLCLHFSFPEQEIQFNYNGSSSLQKYIKSNSLSDFIEEYFRHRIANPSADPLFKANLNPHQSSEPKNVEEYSRLFRGFIKEELKLYDSAHFTDYLSKNGLLRPVEILPLDQAKEFYKDILKSQNN